MSVRRRPIGLTTKVVDRGLRHVGTTVALRTGRQHVAVTFDDGPDPSSTPGVLRSLDRNAATATFFVLMTRARRFPSLVGDVAAQGHEIALHGADHRRFSEFSYRELLQRTSDARSELEDLLGAPVSRVRPPYGLQTLAWARVRRTLRIEPVLWNREAQDWRDLSIPEMVRGATRGARRGDILLVHDSLAGPEDGAHDGPQPLIDRAALTDEVLRSYGDQGLTGRSVRAIVESDPACGRGGGGTARALRGR